MGFARAQRRQAKKAFGLKTDAQVTAFLDALRCESQVKAEKIKAEELLKEAAPMYKAELRAAISSEFVILFAAFLRMKWSYGATRLERSVQEFMDFAEDMKDEKTKIPTLIELLKDETGYDIEEHAARMAKEAGNAD